MPGNFDILNQIADGIDWVNRKVGRVVSWLTFTMAVVTFSVATLRYGFTVGWVWLQETYVWMHGTIIMVAMGYTLMAGGHVRVDIIYRTASVRYQALVDLFGTLFLLMPTIYVVTKYCVPYVILSWERFETSREAGGLHGLYFFKTTMVLFCVLLALQAIAIVIRSCRVLLTGEAPPAPDEDASEMTGG